MNLQSNEKNTFINLKSLIEGYLLMNCKDYKNKLSKKLSVFFGTKDVICEWDVAKDSMDDYNRLLYCPRLDLAVGPFNITRNSNQGRDGIFNLISDKRDYFKHLFEQSVNHKLVLQTFDQFWNNLNLNPRCSIAIEVEKSGTRKHMLGDLINASLLG